MKRDTRCMVLRRGKAWCICGHYWDGLLDCCPACGGTQFEIIERNQSDFDIQCAKKLKVATKARKLNSDQAKGESDG